MDRAFWSVLDTATGLQRLPTLGVGLRSYSEPWLDTTSPFGEALYCTTIVYAQIELELIRDGVKAGMDRARRQGRQINRPKATDRRGFSKRFEAIFERLNGGAISQRQAAIELAIGYATWKGLLDAELSGEAESDT